MAARPGKLTEGIETAGRLAALGIDPLRFLNSNSDLERDILIQVANEVLEIKNIEQENLAKRVALEVSKLFSK